VQREICSEGRPDAKGLLRWELNLGPKQAKEMRVEYAIEYPNALAEPPATPAAGSPLRRKESAGKSSISRGSSNEAQPQTFRRRGNTADTDPVNGFGFKAPR